jgi:hypothetical protein
VQLDRFAYAALKDASDACVSLQVLSERAREGHDGNDHYDNK